MTYDGSVAPAALLPLLRTSVERLHASAAALTDDDVGAPSLLPGWTRAHVLTHIARSADSRTRLLTAARTGADLAQYDDEAQREREIEEGAGRPAAELAADLRGALGGFLTTAAEHPDTEWEVPVRRLGGGMRPVRGAVGSMLREVEVHHTDLGRGHRPADWPPFFIARELATTAAGLRERDDAPGMVLIADEDRVLRPVGGGRGPRVSGPATALLGWLTGRADGHGLTLDPPGPLPDVPAWRS
ncbi:maleylpyruvate isomerase [Streptomyces cinereoruber]|uniref:Maleylpyruvate isomerase n=1 Tax=Streptomyces cinereoruber TaxID=67260 RepID=A0AAV4KAB0_9ACTN|nr:maleylpyruvate isomerase family mycothiol-dependent enzyme [Streptomyces cinereoruber]MBB4158546.1 maleylpyruvate isomerase [Streptomyces cinereoruber]MBY8814501.1 maleylpyruvate isomerase family mycothiol-dependent enzyme [Streptomyces cinereoruber]NIH59207.1 maleylpyruvate isomerase [Streptomyces cinereoruber]QEV34846.1 maleylpyruvate isomerase family mycothiol-dependent enzyme [Streptomyces cinereoruber]GGR03726.1 maleylpyruvate isomerase [Streptomyces cinereoruber]